MKASKVPGSSTRRGASKKQKKNRTSKRQRRSSTSPGKPSAMPPPSSIRAKNSKEYHVRNIPYAVMNGSVEWLITLTVSEEIIVMMKD